MADSSKDLQLRELKDMINDLKKMIKTLQATVDAANKREEALTQERGNLKEEVDLLRKKLFGSSSEKRSMDVPGQLNLFNEAELEQNPTIAEPEALESLLPEKETKKRKSRATNAERFKGIPVVKKYLDLPDAEKVCGRLLSVQTVQQQPLDRIHCAVFFVAGNVLDFRLYAALPRCYRNRGSAKRLSARKEGG